MLEIESQGDGTTVVRAIGECDWGDRDRLLQTLLAVLASAPARVIVSLEACDYIDSSVVSALLQYRRKLKDRFVLVVPEDRSIIHRILSILGLHAVLGVRSSPAGAQAL
jgi:anti-anti-sigma factor